jgi:AAA domain
LEGPGVKSGRFTRIMNNTEIDFVSLMEPVAHRLLGAPNKALSGVKDLRYGTKGSLSINLAKGTWYDHEARNGGGCLDFVARETGLHDADAVQWLRQEGFLTNNASAQRLTDGSTQRAAPLHTLSDFKLVAKFDYVAVDCTRLFQVLRFERPDGTKTFRQRHRDAKGSWVNNMDGVERVLYRLPDVIEAITTLQSIFLVEGERKSDTLAAWGIFSTCNVGGAGKWLPSYTETLRDADVIILPDNDEPGRRHAQLVAGQLHGVAKRVRILELPDLPSKGDIVDWAAARGTRKVLWSLVETTAVDWAPPPLTSLQQQDRPSSGATKANDMQGGTATGLRLLTEAVAMATGRDLLGEVTFDGPLRVWIWNGEDPRDEIERRVAGICQHYGLEAERELQGRLFIDSGLDNMPLKLANIGAGSHVIFDENVVSQIIATIRQNQLDVASFDPLVSLHTAPENDNIAVDQIVKGGFGRIAVEGNCAIELAHHTRKPGPGQAELTVDDARGGSAIVNAVRSCRVVNRMSVTEARDVGISPVDRLSYFRIDRGKANMAPPEAAQWTRTVSLQIPNGDNVGVLERWVFPDAFNGVTTADIDWVRTLVREKEFRADSRAADWIGKPVAERLKINLADDAGRARIKRVLKTWTMNGVLATEVRHDRNRNKCEFVMPGNWNEASETTHAGAA